MDMKFFKKPIFTNFAPNITRHEVMIAYSFLFFPWKWFALKKGKYIKEVENNIKKIHGVKYAFTADSGRTCLNLLLRSFGVKTGSEVLVQAYTCAVVINAIKWLGATPVFVDIDESLNMSTDDLKKKVSSKSKIIIIQHTFGLPAEIDKICEIAKKNEIKIIEDCAHSFGATYNQRLTGTYGDAAMFSFGSGKIISSIRGGSAITNSRLIANKMDVYLRQIPKMSFVKIFQHLLYYPIFSIAKPLYNIGIGKLIFYTAKKLNILAKIIYPSEKNGKQTIFFPSLFPNALAAVASKQISNIKKSNRDRTSVAEKYIKLLDKSIKYQQNQEGRVWMRFPIFIDDPKKILLKAKKNGILLGDDWLGSVIVPSDVNISKFGYRKGECPNAEMISKKIILLPTQPTITNKDIKKITGIINENY